MQAGVHEKKACLSTKISFRDGPIRGQTKPKAGPGNERERKQRLCGSRIPVCVEETCGQEKSRESWSLALLGVSSLSSPPALTSHRQHHERPPRRHANPRVYATLRGRRSKREAAGRWCP